MQEHIVSYLEDIKTIDPSNFPMAMGWIADAVMENGPITPEWATIFKRYISVPIDMPPQLKTKLMMKMLNLPTNASSDTTNTAFKKNKAPTGVEVKSAALKSIEPKKLKE